MKKKGLVRFFFLKMLILTDVLLVFVLELEWGSYETVGGGDLDITSGLFIWLLYLPILFVL